MAPAERRVLVAALVVLALAGASLAAAASTPSASVPLARGQQSSYSWIVSASRLDAGSGAAQPCLSVAITHRKSRFSYARSRFRDCAPSSLSRSAQPLLAGGTHLANPGQPSMTVFAVATAPVVSRVRMTVAGSGPTTVPVREPEAIKGLHGPKHFGIAVIALHGTACVERLETKSAAGRTLWQGAPNLYPYGSDCAAE